MANDKQNQLSKNKLCYQSVITAQKDRPQTRMNTGFVVFYIDYFTTILLLPLRFFCNCFK